MSQIKTADACSLKWHYHYVDKIPAPEDRAATVFGTVVHNGVEQWYGMPGTDNHKTTDLKTYIHNEWFNHLPMDVGIALRHCIGVERELVNLEVALRLGRPDLKNPRGTKAFLESEQWRKFSDVKDELLRVADKCEDMRWAKDENAFQGWQKSMHIGNQLQQRWQHYPRPLVVEHQFTIEFAGVEIQGRIDQIRMDPDPVTGETMVEGLDLKTGRQKLTQMDAFLQAFLYNEACELDSSLPVPDVWTYFMARLNRPQHGHIDRARHSKLAERIVRRALRQIEADDFAPQYSMLCNMCDYSAMCEEEVSIWPPGEDSAVLEAPGAAMGQTEAVAAAIALVAGT